MKGGIRARILLCCLCLVLLSFTLLSCNDGGGAIVTGEPSSERSQKGSEGSGDAQTDFPLLPVDDYGTPVTK